MRQRMLKVGRHKFRVEQLADIAADDAIIFYDDRRTVAEIRKDVLSNDYKLKLILHRLLWQDVELRQFPMEEYYFVWEDI